MTKTKLILLIVFAFAISIISAPILTTIGVLGEFGVAMAVTNPADKVKEKKPGEERQRKEDEEDEEEEDEENEIVIGKGWGDFTLGATGQELVKSLGKPDADSTPNMLKWHRQRISCLLDDNGVAFELRFEKGFDYALRSGITIGSSEEEVVEAYGTPGDLKSEQGPRGVIKRATYPSRGLIFWTENEKVAMIVLLAPVQTTPVPGAGGMLKK